MLHGDSTYVCMYVQGVIQRGGHTGIPLPPPPPRILKLIFFLILSSSLVANFQPFSSPRSHQKQHEEVFGITVVI